MNSNSSDVVWVLPRLESKFCVTQGIQVVLGSWELGMLGGFEVPVSFGAMFLLLFFKELLVPMPKCIF